MVSSLWPDLFEGKGCCGRSVRPERGLGLERGHGHGSIEDLMTEVLPALDPCWAPSRLGRVIQCKAARTVQKHAKTMQKPCERHANQWSLELLRGP